MLAGILVVCVAIIICYYSWFNILGKKSETKTLNKPPGPWGFPILGHLPFFGKNPGKTFMKWGQIYGPIFSIKMGRIPAVVLNDGKLIKEAMNLDTFAGRYPFRNLAKPVKVKGIAGIDGPGLVEQRKFAIKHFKAERFSKSEFECRTVEELSIFLERLGKKAKDSFNNQKPLKMVGNQFFQFPILNSIWVSIVGRRIGEDDPRLETLNKATHEFTETGRSTLSQMSWFLQSLSDILRFLGRNSAVNALVKIDAFMDEQIEESRSNYVAGHPLNFTHAYFDQVAKTTNPDSSFFQGKEQSFVTTEVFIGALDTIPMSIDWLLLYMAKEPQVQEKFQAEIDDIIGSEVDENGVPRTPTILDKVKMPYTDAVIKEHFRMSSLVPLAFYHRATEDVTFHGYSFPKGTVIVPNLYGVHHDPGIWEDPETFRPERFLEQELGGMSPTNRKPPGLVIPFCTGKRSCVGEGFARDHCFLIATHFFQKFSVSFANGPPSGDPIFGITMGPPPFELIVRERNCK